MAQTSFDLYTLKNFFDSDTCRDIIAKMRCANATAALTYGKGEAAIDERVRRVRQVSVSEETAAYVTQRLEDHRAPITKHFGIKLTSFEEPQFLCYRTGDFFVAHQDGNTGLLRLESDRLRRISITLFLNSQADQTAPDTYGGGAIVFSDWRGGASHKLVGETGTLVGFRSETTHEVEPVTHGERYVIVSWYRCSG